jgi:hypothetical protein
MTIAVRTSTLMTVLVVLCVGILWWFEYNICLISQHHFSFYLNYMFRSLLDHLQVMHICKNYKNYTYNAYITCL